RVMAASRAADAGYKLAFHFDPIIVHDNWEREYEEVVQLLFSQVDSKMIVWISMGALRYLPQLKRIGERRFAGSPIFSEEFVCGLDGKMRYFRTQREEMYRHLYGLLRERVAADTCIYLCMESDEIWEKVFGYAPHTRGGLSAMLDRAALSAMTR
ncbi:MAG: DNA photolyase, partial [Desulfobacterales bacterium]|nr:DNA photolyase [Desulfobacterales bacterium]